MRNAVRAAAEEQLKPKRKKDRDVRGWRKRRGLLGGRETKNQRGGCPAQFGTRRGGEGFGGQRSKRTVCLSAVVFGGNRIGTFKGGWEKRGDRESCRSDEARGLGARTRAARLTWIVSSVASRGLQ